jgi:hypothetical protein
MSPPEILIVLDVDINPNEAFVVELPSVLTLMAPPD